MTKRLLFLLVVALCLLPVVRTGFGDAWISPWRSAELDACVGRYRLPSGVMLAVEREGNLLVAVDPRRELRRGAAWFYTGRDDPIRLRFLSDDRLQVTGVDLSGVSPRIRGERMAAHELGTTELVDVGGHRLRLNVAGRHHSGPTVLLETGPLGGLEGVAQWQADVARFARVVAYDHAGSGGSEPGTEPQTAAVVAAQLRKALRVLEVEPPFVVAGMSMGGPYSIVFANLYPEDVAGLVWIDPTPDWDDLYRWCGDHAPEVGKRVRRSMQWIDLTLQKRVDHAHEVGRRSEWNSMDLTWREVRSAIPLKRVPVIQITGAKDYQTRQAVRKKVEYFDAWLTRYVPQAKQVLAKQSGHGVYAKEPELVLEAIRELVGRGSG